MKDDRDTAGGHQGQQESTSYLAKRAACKANAFESWLSSYQGRLATACADGRDCVHSARGDKEAELQPEPKATVLELRINPDYFQHLRYRIQRYLSTGR